MPDIAGIPYFELEFNKEAKLVHPEQQQAVIDSLKAGASPTDLLVFSHGWNHDEGEARALDRVFFTTLAADLKSDGTIPARQFAILAVFWPSKKWAEKDLIPGGAASAANDLAADKVLLEQIAILESITGKDLSELRTLAPDLGDSKSAREKFTRAVIDLLPAEAAEDNAQLTKASVATDVAGDKLLDKLSRKPVEAPTGGMQGAASIGDLAHTSGSGSAAGLGDLFSGIKAGAMNLLNVTTYYQMKSRAGIVGEQGVNRVLRAIRAAVPSVRI